MAKFKTRGDGDLGVARMFKNILLVLKELPLHE